MLIVSHQCRDLQSLDFDFTFHTVVSLHLILQVKSRCRGHFPGLVLRGNAEAGRGPLCGWGARPAPRGHTASKLSAPCWSLCSSPFLHSRVAMKASHLGAPFVCAGLGRGPPRVFALLLSAPELNWECLPVSSRGHGSGGACVKHAPRPTSRVLSVPHIYQKGRYF